MLNELQRNRKTSWCVLIEIVGGTLECFWIRKKRSEFRYMHFLMIAFYNISFFSHSNTKFVLYLFCEHCCVNMLSATNPQFCGAYCRGLLFPTVINEIPVLFLWYVANLLARWLLHILKKMVLFTETLLFGDSPLISEDEDYFSKQTIIRRGLFCMRKFLNNAEEKKKIWIYHNDPSKTSY